MFKFQTAVAALTVLTAAVIPAAACEREQAVRVVRFASAQSRPVIRLADDTVRFRTADTYRVRFAEEGRVRLTARTEGLVLVRVLDSWGRCVTTSADCAEANPYVTFRPVRNSAYTLQVVNQDDADVDYTLRLQ